MGRFHRWLGGLPALIFVTAMVAAPAAQSATLKADYELQGTYASTLGGGAAPDLTDIGLGNAFATDSVNGVTREVLTFPQGNGLSLPSTGLVSPTDHSEVIVFRLADLSGYRRILDFSDGSLDSGLYDRNSTLDIYDGADQQSGALLSPGNWVEIAVTSKSAPLNHEDVELYVNGAQVLSFNPSQGFDISAGAIHFFKDDGSSEESAGAVACIRVYDGILSGTEVAQIADDASFCGPPPSPSSSPPPGNPGDTIAPNTKLKKKPAKETGDDTPTFKFTSTEAGSTFKCRIDRKKFKPCHSPFTTKPLDSGKHTFRVDAVDPAGNADPSPAKFKFTVLP